MKEKLFTYLSPDLYFFFIFSFNNSVRNATAVYYSNLVTKIKGNRKVLLDRITDIVTPVLPAVSVC